MKSIANLERFLESPVGQELAAQAEEKRLRRRQALTAEIDALTADHEKAVPRLVGALERAEEDRRKAEQALRGKERALSSARMAHLEAGNRFQHELGIRRHELEETADPLIEAFVREMNDAHDSTRNGKLHLVEHPGRENPYTGGRKSVTYTNHRSLRAHLAGLRAAASAAEALKYEPLTEGEVTETLERIRATIPPIGPIEEA
jgi:hypothetical protein